MEFWCTRRLQGNVEEAGKPLEIDNFTDRLLKTGFAKIQVEINSTEPLKPGVLIKGKNQVFWQAFVYK